MALRADREVLTVAGREVALTNPDKVLFPQAGYTKRDLVHYYLAVADGALRGAGNRPNVLVRYPNGIAEEFFFQKRAPQSRPDWIEVVQLKFPSGRTAEEVVPRDDAQRWPGWPTWRASNCTRIRCARTISIIRTSCAWTSIRCRAWSGRRSARSRGRARDARRARPGRLAQDVGLARDSHLRAHRAALDLRPGAPRGTGAGARGRAARAGAGDQQVVEGGAARRVPGLQPEREGPHRGQRLLGAADAGRAGVGAARAGTRSRLRSGDFTLATMPARFAAVGDRHAAIDAHAGSLDTLLELSARHEREGQGDAPWPPHYRKQAGEAPRVAPSRRRTPGIR